MKRVLFIIALNFFAFCSISQNVGVGNNNPQSKLHVSGAIRSDTLIGPGVRNLFAAPNGRIYDSLVIPSTLNWEITGNSNITLLNFLGTTNASDLIFRTNNIERARILSTGNVGVGTPAPAASAIVDITSTSAGFAMPRMTTVQRIAIAAPIAGLQVYDINLKGFYYFDGTKWDCANNPAGTVQYFANVTVPNGYLECNGQGVSTTTYPELFAAIGYLYGGGGATFNVPDLRGEFVRGLDMGKGVNAGRVIGTNEAASTHRELGGTGGVGTINDWWSDSKLNVVTDGLTTSTPPSNGGQLVNPYINNPATVLVYEFSHRPRNVALLPCIKF